MSGVKAVTRSEFVPAAPVGTFPASDSGDGPRRLQRMGAVTVGVSLPRVWVGEHGLTPGSTVHFTRLPDGSLILRHQPRGSVAERFVTSVSPRAAPEHLFRQLVAAYLGGATEFTVLEEPELSPQTRSITRAFIRRTIQPEVASESEDRLTLKDVSLGVGFSARQLLPRMYQIVVELQTDGGLSWGTTRPTNPASLASRDDDVDRHAWLIERVIGLQLTATQGSGPDHLPAPELLELLLVTRALERIADHAVTMGDYGAQLAGASLPARVTQALTSYHRQALEHLAESFRVMQHPEVAAANEVLDAGEALRATHSTLTEALLVRGTLGTLAPMTAVSIGLILQSIDRTTAYAQDIAQVGLDRAAKSCIDRDNRLPGVRFGRDHGSTIVDSGGKTKNERKPR